MDNMLLYPSLYLYPIICNLDVIYNMIQFILNDELISTECAPEETLLDFVRYHKHLKGTKIGCREGDCGACTVMSGVLRSGKMEYETVTSCLMPMGNVVNKHIVTIEGISSKGTKLNLVQHCVADQNGSQCGFCTPGFIMSLTCFAISGEEKSQQNAVKSMDGNICRCTGYKSLERAAEQLANALEMQNIEATQGSDQLQIVPPYFTSIPERLKQLPKEQKEQTFKTISAFDLAKHNQGNSKLEMPVEENILKNKGKKSEILLPLSKVLRVNQIFAGVVRKSMMQT